MGKRRKKSWPVPDGHRPRYAITDGRHRWSAAVIRGAPTRLRCDVLTRDGGQALRQIDVCELIPDSDVQFAFAFNLAKANQIAATWEDRKAGVLTVTPLGSDGLEVSEKAAVKIALDGRRRRVEPIELLLDGILAGEQEAIAINRAATETGWEIGHTGGGIEQRRLSCAARLIALHRSLGADGLRRTLQLATHWRGDPGGNHADWLGALGLLVRDGYDEAITPASIGKFRTIAPLDVLRRARGDVVAAGGGLGSGGNHGFGGVSYAAATRLRRVAGLRVRPAHRTSRKASRTRPLK